MADLYNVLLTQSKGINEGGKFTYNGRNYHVSSKNGEKSFVRVESDGSYFTYDKTGHSHHKPNNYVMDYDGGSSRRKKKSKKSRKGRKNRNRSTRKPYILW